MKRQGKKSLKFKVILTSVIALIIILSLAAGKIALTYQAKAVVNDYTVNNTEDIGGSGDDQAVLSESVKILIKDEAQKVNNSIKSIESNNNGTVIVFSLDTLDKIKELGVGDIFYLEGDEKTPFANTYIGKVESVDKDASSITLKTTNPCIDEVFDKLSFQLDETLTTDKIDRVDLAEGVTYEITDDVFKPLAQNNKLIASNLSKESKDDGLVFNFELDILKLLKIKPKETTQEKYEHQEGYGITVYITNTGKCYHKDTCPCLAQSKSEITLRDAVDQEFKPCSLCKAPLLKDDEGVVRQDVELKLKGKVGIKNIKFNNVIDFDLINFSGFRNLILDVEGDFFTDATLEAGYEMEFGGRTTTKTIGNNFKLEGLDEKLFPIAFIEYNGTFSPVVQGNDSVRFLTSKVPLSIGVMVYIDINGNIKFNLELKASSGGHFYSRYELVKDSKFIGKKTYKFEPTNQWGASAEISGDIDSSVGGSIMLYVFNVNVLELSIAKVGLEVQGNVKVETTSANYADDPGNLFVMSNQSEDNYNARLYLKLLELNVKLKCKIEFLILSADADLNFDYLHKDITLAEWGKKSPVSYNPSEMSYSLLTASDKEYCYSKDTNGYLIKEKNNYKTVLYKEDFFSICGIDESFIYVLRKNSKNGVYNIYRVSKSDGTSKMIVDSVVNPLTMDNTYMYYVVETAKKEITRINRYTLKADSFAKFNEEVQIMAEQGEEYYIITSRSSFFGSTCYYYLTDSKGNIIDSYGSGPDVLNYNIIPFDDYYMAIKFTASGFLRNIADEVYWLSSDKQNKILTDHVSGWNYKNEGIFTTAYNDNSSKTPFKIVLYRASDGQQIKVTDVYSDHAFFTLCKSDDGSWYYIDQTETQLILYKMSSDFSNINIIKTFELSEISYNLEDCGMRIMNNRLYFYTIPDNQTSHMLYRYDLYY